MDETQQIRDLAIRLAREAGAIQRDRYETDFQIESKGAKIDLVTEVDRLCEELIVNAIEEERPDDAILAEDGGGTDSPGAEWRGIVDPLEGQRNKKHVPWKFVSVLPLSQEILLETTDRMQKRNCQPINYHQNLT